MSAPINLAPLEASDMVLLMRTLVSKRLDAGDPESSSKGKFITTNSDTESMQLRLEWFVVKDKGSICHCSILQNFMFVYVIDGVSGSYTMCVTLG